MKAKTKLILLLIPALFLTLIMLGSFLVGQNVVFGFILPALLWIGVYNSYEQYKKEKKAVTQ